MTGKELAEWQARTGLTTAAAAKALGVTRQALWTMKKSDDVGLRTALACSAISLGIPPSPIAKEQK